MNKRHVFYVGLVLIAALALFGVPMVASAAYHTSSTAITVMDANGAQVTSSTPYSPKQTCGGCHFDCATGLYTSVTASFCQSEAARTTWFGGGSCNTPGKCPDYESMQTITVNKVAGYVTSGGTATTNFDVVVPVHGAATGKHSTLGRNEGMTNAQRTIWGVPATASGPGMFGRF